MGKKALQGKTAMRIKKNLSRTILCYGVLVLLSLNACPGPSSANAPTCATPLAQVFDGCKAAGTLSPPTPSSSRNPQAIGGNRPDPGSLNAKSPPPQPSQNSVSPKPLSNAPP